MTDCNPSKTHLPTSAIQTSKLITSSLKIYYGTPDLPTCWLAELFDLSTFNLNLSRQSAELIG